MKRSRRKSKKNNLVLPIVFAVLAYVVFFDSDETPTPKKAPANPDKQIVEQKRPEGPLVWPPATAQEVQLAANPMTDNYLLMLDTSGSMGENVCAGNEQKITAAKRAVKAFFRNLGPKVNVGLYTFSDSVREVMPIGKHGAEDFDRSVDALVARGGTPLRRALKTSEQLLRKAAQGQGGYGSYNLVLITDGHSSDGKPYQDAQEIAQTTAITINAIGFCTGATHSLNIQGYTNFSTADNAEQLVESLSATVQAEQDAFDVSDFNPSE